MPPQVRRAVILLWVTLLAGVALWIWELLYASPPDETGWNDMFWVIATTLFLGAIPIYFVSRRHNWARWLLLVFTIAGLAIGLWMVPLWESWKDIALEAVFIIAEGLALYWLFSGAGSDWFRRER